VGGGKFYNMTSDSNIVVEYLPNHPKVVGLSLATIAGTRKWSGKKLYNVASCCGIVVE
jgi:hypothetical protein